MSLTELITQFLNQAKQEDQNLFPFIANKETFNSKKDSVYYSGPYWDEKEIEAIFYTVLKGKWLSSGDSVNKFEREFSKKFNKDYSVMVNSGSSANLVMIAALKKYFGWQDGDEIIVSCVGFPTTINPIIQNNLKPVFVDIDWDDLNWNIGEIEKKITSRTKAVFSSPVLGNVYDLKKLIQICSDFGLEIIADNCDSLGSKWNDRYVTDFAVAASCSFYPAHHITTIEGGMVSSNIKEIVDVARSFAWWGRGCYCVGQQNLLPNGVCGKRFDTWIPGYEEIVDHKYVFTNIGYNLKPTDFQGAIGSVQLEKFDEVHRKRRANKQKIDSIFQKIWGVRTINELPESETSWFGVPLICESAEKKRNLVQHLETNRVQTRNYFAGNILMHPAYKDVDDYTKYQNANKVLDQVFFVGCSPTITVQMINYIEEVVDKFIIKETINLSRTLSLSGTSATL
ncbi:MAG: DegT/DnrJ/EryC1/StrS family aminotransferase [Nostoc sp. ChiSLP01]|nr:DegT/DnrJ/EryC1/StrS family aminotransferase [Nostoc sp. CmiSLP01]MDZ8286394.1 DegT/DnrJ/EryC1/StrS family aminotransferase [Nostoc sp. ChiSLP01]